MRTGIVELGITCLLDDEYFSPWDELTPEQRLVFETKATQCDGIGQFGWWCIGCDFCHDHGVVDSYLKEDK